MDKEFLSLSQLDSVSSHISRYIDSKVCTDTATTSSDGLMSDDDKTKLDGIESGAQVNTIETIKVNGVPLTPDNDAAVNIDTTQSSTFIVATLTEGNDMLDAIFPVFRESFTNPYTDSTDTSLVEQVLAKILHKENSETDYWKVTSTSVNDATNEVTFSLTLDQTTETYVASTTDVAFTVTTKADSSDTEQSSSITFGELVTVFDGNGVDANFANLLDLKISNTGLSITYTSGTYTITNVVDGNYILFELSNSTVDSVVRVNKLNITDAESDTTPEPTGTYALWTPSAEFYDINNFDFMNLLGDENRVLADDPGGIKAINNITVDDDMFIDFECTLNDGSTKTKHQTGCAIFNQKPGRFAVTVEDEIQWPSIPSSPKYSVIAQKIGISLSDLAEMIQQNKMIQVYAQYISAIMAGYDNARQRVSYVPATNSIRVDPVEGVTENFGVQLNYTGGFYIWNDKLDAEEVDPNYHEGKVLGQNVTVILEDELGIFAGLKS